MNLLEDGPFTGLRRHGYKVVLLDPPWKYVTRSPKGDGKGPTYRTMSIEDLKALPVADLLAKDAVVLCWIIDSHLELALDLFKTWGVKFKTVGFYWYKTSLDGMKYPIGTGFWTRANPEQCWLGTPMELHGEDEAQWLLATKGKPKRLSRAVRRLIVAPRRQHSRKPDELFPSIEALLDGPYLELFSRERRPGWTTWGDEEGKFDFSHRETFELELDQECMNLIGMDDPFGCELI